MAVAYRPVEHSRFNGLARFTQIVDQRPTTGAVERDDQRVFSMDTSFDVTDRVEWVTKTALRTEKQTVPLYPRTETTTRLAIQRLNVAFYRQLLVGAEYRLLDETETDAARQGWLAEVGWKLHQHFRVGVGYNFTDFSDNEFSDNDYSVKGWFLRVQGMY